MAKRIREYTLRFLFHLPPCGQWARLYAPSLSFLSLFNPQLISCPHPNIPSAFPFPSRYLWCLLMLLSEKSLSLDFFLFLDSPINSAQRNHVLSMPHYFFLYFNQNIWNTEFGPGINHNNYSASCAEQYARGKFYTLLFTIECLQITTSHTLASTPLSYKQHDQW